MFYNLLTMKLPNIRTITQKLFPRYETDDLHSITETAKLVNRDVKTVYYHVYKGHLEVIRKYGLTLVKGESINEFLKGRK